MTHWLLQSFVTSNICYFKLHEIDVKKIRVISCAEKQTVMFFITNCLNFLSHARIASVIWECLKTQSFIFTNR